MSKGKSTLPQHASPPTKTSTSNGISSMASNPTLSHTDNHAIKNKKKSLTNNINHSSCQSNLKIFNNTSFDLLMDPNKIDQPGNYSSPTDKALSTTPHAPSPISIQTQKTTPPTNLNDSAAHSMWQKSLTPQPIITHAIPPQPSR